MRSSNELEGIARDVRLDIFRMFRKSGTGHLAPALSCADIFTELYFAPIINWDERFGEKRDRIVLSKGHACAALYAVLARAEYFSREELLTFYQKNSLLGGHPNVNLKGIETATGALGHGICFATGTAMAAKLGGDSFRTYAVIGDGECEEGSVWEAAMFAANQELDNLVVIIDKNTLQASDRVEDIAPLGKLDKKWESFGWHVVETSGHDFDRLGKAFAEAKEIKGVPTVIIADTIKGKGLRIAEDNKEWHSRAPKGEEWDAVLSDYGIDIKDLETV